MLRAQAGLLLIGLIGLGHAHAAEEVKPLGVNERISTTSAPSREDSDYSAFDANSPAVALNPRDNDPAEVPNQEGGISGFLPSRILFSVWSADDDTELAEGGDETTSEDDTFLVDEEFEIHGKAVESRIANNGLFSFSGSFRISKMGPEDATDPAERARYGAFKPSVAYNPETDQYLVVWYGDDNTAPLVDEEFEIWGRLVEGSAAAGDRTTDTMPGEPFRITAVGPEGESDPAERARYGAFDPKVAYNPATGGYMLVYRADDATVSTAGGNIADDEFEIFAQMLTAEGATAGSPIRVSVMGDDSEANDATRAEYDAGAPALVYNEIAGQFLVAWHGDTNLNGLVNNENEIYVRGINTDGAVPAAQQKVSKMGPDGNASYDAQDPALAVNAANGEYLVSWSGDDNNGPLVNDEFEIFARRLGTTGTPAATQFRVSFMGDDAATDPSVRASFDAYNPTAAYHVGADRYQVGWIGDTDEGVFVDGEFQLHGQGINSDGSLYGSRFPISQANADDESASKRRENAVKEPTAIYADGMVQYFFSADAPALTDPDDGTTSGHFEIMLQRASSIHAIPFATFNETQPTVPAPIKVTYTLENTGPDTMVGNELWVTLSEEWAHPLVVDGCTSYDPSTGICQLPDLAADGEHVVTIQLPTDGTEIGDRQGTKVSLTLHSDTALTKYINENNRLIDYDQGSFVAAVLKVSGGGGALLALLPLLGLLGFSVARRRA